MLNLASLRKSVLIQNISALYGVYAFTYVLPLITVPFLARVLKPDGWGMVAFAQSFGQFLILVIEYGFNLSATREVAARRNDPGYLAEILSSVVLAKMLLCLAAVGASLIALPFVPLLRGRPLLFWAAIAWAASQGMSMLWFYQGLERLRFPSTVEVSFRCITAALILTFIRRPEQAWEVLAINAACAFMSSAWVLCAAIREFGFCRPRLSDAIHVLRVGVTMFVFRSSVALYTTGNAFILGLFVEPRIVGIYAGAERISKSFLGLIMPVSQALYPRMASTMRQGRGRAAVLARNAMFVMVGGAGALALTLIVAAPSIIRTVLGKGFEGAVLPLRLLALLLPIIATSNILGIQWMLPLRRDRAFNTIIISAGALNLVLAWTLAPTLKATGMALAVLVTETCVSASCLAYLHLHSLNPLSGRLFPREAEVDAA